MLRQPAATERCGQHWSDAARLPVTPTYALPPSLSSEASRWSLGTCATSSSCRGLRSRTGSPDAAPCCPSHWQQDSKHTGGGDLPRAPEHVLPQPLAAGLEAYPSHIGPNSSFRIGPCFIPHDAVALARAQKISERAAPRAGAS